MKFYISFLSAFILLISVSCKQEVKNVDEKEILVELNGKYLLKSDLEKAFKKGLNKEDSIKFAENFKDNWIRENLLFDKAERNVNDIDKIEKNVEEYRRHLIVFQYEKQLINEKLNNEISEEELQSFYELYGKNFVLSSPIIKGLFLKIPVNAPQLAEVKKWVKKITPETLEKLEKYTLQNAIVYEYFSDRWVDLDDIMVNIPYVMTNSNKFLKEKKFLEVTEGDYWYYLSIDAYELQGASQPFEFARTRIKDA